MSPAKMLLGSDPKSRLDLLKPMTAERIEANQWKQKKQPDGQSSEHCFKERDNVWVKNFQAGNKWLPGVINKRTEPVSFVVQMSDGHERPCHQDQLASYTLAVKIDMVQSPFDQHNSSP